MGGASETSRNAGIVLRYSSPSSLPSSNSTGIKNGAISSPAPVPVSSYSCSCACTPALVPVLERKVPALIPSPATELALLTVPGAVAPLLALRCESETESSSSGRGVGSWAGGDSGDAEAISLDAGWVKLEGFVLGCLELFDLRALAFMDECAGIKEGNAMYWLRGGN